jgi:hypothetical protein
MRLTHESDEGKISTAKLDRTEASSVYFARYFDSVE